MNQKKQKNRKMSDQIAALISLVSFVCIGILFITSNYNMSHAMKETAENNIITSSNFALE